jgi:cyclopropane-fatty-acyl-phospholipid synthase
MASAPITEASASGYAGASPEAIRHHYDVGDAFYSLWLDSTLTYSCGLWRRGDETLVEAQANKLDHLIAGAQAAGKDRVLDIGCGWGGLTRRLLRAHGVGEVTGLTLSEAQARAISSWGEERASARVENWAEHDPDATYDAVISIEAFEHFAAFGMTREQRVASYRGFFERCHGWLSPGGRLAIQTGVKGSNTKLSRKLAGELLFIARRIFPESELPWASEILEAAERRFELASLRNDPEDYVRTLGAWQQRLTAGRERALELLGEERVGDYERYLQAAREAYEGRHLGLLRLVFERV